MADFGFSADKVTIIVEADDKASDKLDKISGSLNTLGRTGSMIAGAGLAVAGAAIAGIGGIIAKTVPMAMDFEGEMRNVNAVAQISEEEFQQLTKDVLDFSMTTRASATDVAKSLYNVVSAGFDTAEGFDIMTASSRAAGAGLADTESTSRLLIAALRSYQLPISEAGRLTDVFLQTVNEGITTLPEIASGMGRVLPVAASLGVGIEELGFSLARATQTGLSTDEAFTRINATYTALLSPSEDLQAAIEDLGYASGYDLVQQTGGALSALKVLKDEGFMDTTDAVAELFPNIRALGGVLALTTDEATLASGAIEDFGERAEGAVDRAREQQYASFAAQLELIKSKFEVIALKVGTAVLPVLGKLGVLVSTYVVPAVDALATTWENVWSWIDQVITNITEFAWTMSDLFTTFEDGSTIWDGFFEALGMTEEKAQSLGRSINNIARFLSDMWRNIRNVANGIREFLTPVIEWIQQNIQLQDILIALGILIGVTILGALYLLAQALAPVIALVGGLILVVSLVRQAWEENWLGIRDKLTEVWEGTIRPALENLWNWLQVNIPLAIETLRNWWDNTFIPALQRVWNWISENLLPIFKTIADWLNVTIPAAIAEVKKWWDNEFVPAMGRVRDWIDEHLVPKFIEVRDWLEEKITTAIETVRDWWDDEFIPALTRVSEKIAEYLAGKYAELLVWLHTDLPDAIAEGKRWLLEEFKPALEKVKEYIEDPLIPILNDLVTEIAENVDGALEDSSETWNKYHVVLETIWGYISENVIPIFEELSRVISGLLNLALLLVALTIQWFINDVLTPLYELAVLARDIFLDIADTLDLRTNISLSDTAFWADALHAALSPITFVLQTIHRWLKNVADALDALPNVLPDWLQWSSPPPLELALRGINSALVEVNPNLEKFNAIANATGYTGVGFNMPGRGNNETHYHYHLGVNSTQSNRRVMDDFNLMRAMAG